MTKNKTYYKSESVTDYIMQLTDNDKKEGSFKLIEILKECINEETRMFGTSIIGFGEYYYKYASGHEGYAPILGFSPRKTAISLYIYTGADQHNHLLDGLGKFKIGKACIYIKRLDGY